MRGRYVAGIAVLAGSAMMVLPAGNAMADGPGGQITVSPGDQSGVFGQPSVGIGAASPGAPGGPGHQVGSGSAGGAGPGLPSPGFACVYDASGGMEAYLKECLGIKDTATVAQPTPEQLAVQAYQQLVLPLPVPHFSPDLRTSSGPATVVGEHTWVWTDKAGWAVQSKRVQAGPVWAEAVATPTKLDFTPSTDRPLSCPGPGTAYSASAGLHGASPDCDYVFARPREHVDATFAIQWSVRWTGSTGAVPAGGTLPDMTSRAVLGFAVNEVQSLNAG